MSPISFWSIGCYIQVWCVQLIVRLKRYQVSQNYPARSRAWRCSRVGGRGTASCGSLQCEAAHIIPCRQGAVLAGSLLRSLEVQPVINSTTECFMHKASLPCKGQRASWGEAQWHFPIRWSALMLMVGLSSPCLAAAASPPGLAPDQPLSSGQLHIPVDMPTNSFIGLSPAQKKS